jgi:hypothetical protein
MNVGLKTRRKTVTVTAEDDQPWLFIHGEMIGTSRACQGSSEADPSRIKWS